MTDDVSVDSIVSSCRKNSNDEDVAITITKQMEFYFSDANLFSDNYMMKQINSNADGWVNVPLMAKFKKIKALTKNWKKVVEAIRTHSSLLIIDDEGCNVRRIKPLPIMDKMEVYQRTVLVENIPDDQLTIDGIAALFEPCGDVLLVRVKGSLTKKNMYVSRKTCTEPLDAIVLKLLPPKPHALVEFKTSAEATEAARMLNNEREWRTGLRVKVLENLVSESTKEKDKKKRGGDDKTSKDTKSIIDISITPIESQTETNGSATTKKKDKDKDKEKEKEKKIRQVAPPGYFVAGVTMNGIVHNVKGPFGFAAVHCGADGTSGPWEVFFHTSEVIEGCKLFLSDEIQFELAFHDPALGGREYARNIIITKKSQQHVASDMGLLSPKPPRKSDSSLLGYHSAPSSPMITRRATTSRTTTSVVDNATYHTKHGGDLAIRSTQEQTGPRPIRMPLIPRNNRGFSETYITRRSKHEKYVPSLEVPPPESSSIKNRKYSNEKRF